MPRAIGNGIALEYEVIGAAGAPPILLIAGYGVQLIGWPDELCHMLVKRGLRVIRFDNRDIGLSQKTKSEYTLDEMAADAAGLLDALGGSAAHVVGASMGGEIAQLLAIHHPTKVRSLCSMMSSTGDRSVGYPQPEIVPFFRRPFPAARAPYIEARIDLARRSSSPAFVFDERRARALNEREWDRCHFPIGMQRHRRAVLASSDRTEALRSVSAPTLVVHGEQDVLVHRSGGQATARAVPGARELLVSGMGHDLPEALWPTFVNAIIDNAQRAT